ncbi:MAG: hypothetical protein WCL32_23415, partial [Planctomycetota bacterium]
MVRWIGSDGLKAALTASRRCSIKVLRSLAEGLGIALNKELSRQQLITDIVTVASKRIDKSLESLMQLSQDELENYFHDIEVESKELLELLKELEI